ncbi:sensor histidine kinase [Acidipropionibacterium virtanenii]|uniref:Histidine kinase/HSP90-like ATPase domain-containing protein n=1 Tax=Acidipropionibacterium virtanenii TaxID=2057246 RepID=A0A344UVD0_9ACTN|nr:ATP-binding protein [Acidipropionibacterium virtanenii]AXE39228.1 hypothetical protein JS278_02076 [Acidipropionibacterium virtanenii]
MRIGAEAADPAAGHVSPARGHRPKSLSTSRVQHVVVVLRWVFLAHAVLMAAARWDATTRRGLLLVLLGLMLAWTVVITAQSRWRWWRWRAVAVVDVAVSVVVTLASRAVLRPGAPTAGFEGVGYYWVTCAPLAVSLAYGSIVGVLGALLVILSGAFEAGHGHLWAWSADLLMLAACWSAGRLMGQMRELLAENQRNHAITARMAERERLGRIVHDGVLQVLSMVEREGPELGSRGVVLAGLAREQGAQLRRMLQASAGESVPEDCSDAGAADLVATVEAHESDSVTVSAMAGELLLAAEMVHEIDAALQQVLLNVTQHAGSGAHCWILIEQEDDQIVISARDNGVGMSPEATDRFSKEGRMGISRSIIGRIHDLGGSSEMTSAPGHGVEWEFRIPIHPEGGDDSPFARAGAR